MSATCSPSIWAEIKTSTNYQKCNSTTTYLMESTLSIEKMCGVTSCKAVLDAISSGSECSYGNGFTNKNYSCTSVSTATSTPYTTTKAVETTLAPTTSKITYLPTTYTPSASNTQSGSTAGSKGNSDSKTGMYIGIAGGVAFVLAIIICCYVIRSRKRRNGAKADGNFHEMDVAYSAPTEVHNTAHPFPIVENVGIFPSTNSSGTGGSTMPTSYMDQNDSQTSYSSNASSQLDIQGLGIWRIDPSDINMVKPLAKGACGEVWLAIYMKQNVAVKKLLNHKRNTKEIEKFIMEIQLVAK